MLSPKFSEVLSSLMIGTEKNFVTWQDIPAEDMFRTQVAGGLIRVGKMKDDTRLGYSFLLTGKNGALAAELEFWPGDDGYDLISELYNQARLHARGGDHLLDMIIAQGRSWK